MPERTEHSNIRFIVAKGLPFQHNLANIIQKPLTARAFWPIGGKKNPPAFVSKAGRLYGSGGGIRTYDTPGMNRMLWPTELRRHMVAGAGFEPATSGL